MDSFPAKGSPQHILQSSEENTITEQRLNLLLELTNEVVSNLDFPDLLRAISASLRRVLRCLGVGVFLPDEDAEHLRIYAFDVREGELPPDIAFPVEGSEPGEVFRTGRACIAKPDTADTVRQGAPLPVGLQTVAFLPLTSRN